MIHHPRQLLIPHLAREEGGPVAAGSNVAWDPGYRSHVLIDSVQLTFATSAVAANRRVHIIIATGTDTDVLQFSIALQTASLTYNYWFLPNVGSSGASAVDNRVINSLPWPIPFQSPFFFGTSVDNMDAGDQFTSYRIRYRRWQDPVII